jgi:iron-sulfur cluster assembly accessory protein
MITLTASAQDKVKRLLEQQGKLETAGLRVKVIGGGCSGFQYQLFFDEQIDEMDHQVEAGPVRVVIDPMSVQYLKGVEIDYLDGLNESGFKITNPNAQSECGCGKSFGA